MTSGTIERTFQNKLRKETENKFYQVTATPVLTYVSETRAMRNQESQRIHATEISFFKIKG